jgi:branched-chain amino acid transport system permease protein
MKEEKMNVFKTWMKLILLPQYYVTLGLVIFLFCLPALYESAFYTQVMIMVIFFAYLTACWNIISGYAGQLSIGNATFMMIGAYTSTLLFINLGLSPWIGMIVGGIIAAFAGFLIGYPTFRLRGAYFSIATIVWAEGLRKIVENTEHIGKLTIGGAEGLTLPLLHHAFLQYQFVDKIYYYYIILIMMFGILYVTYRIDRSKIGYYLTAIREDEEAAQALSINVRKYKLIALMISAFCTALAGTFYAQLMLYIEPNGVGGLPISIEMLLLGVIGGRGTILGPVLGAFLLVPIREMTRTYVGTTYLGAHLVIYGLIMVVVILFLPHGIEGPIKKGFLRLTGRGSRTNPVS